MPAAPATLTVKKADGTTDIVWTLFQASGGDKSPAVYRSNTVGTAVFARPEFKLVARENGDGKRRWVEGWVTFPYILTGTDGKPYIADKSMFKLTGSVPFIMPDTDLNEAAAQSVNLFKDPSVVACLKTGSNLV